MISRLLSFIFLCSSLNTVFAQTATPPASGDGSIGSPYTIASLDNLYWMATQASSFTGVYFSQTGNIDASSSSSWNSGAGFNTIGSNSIPFQGNYDGNYYTISGITINRTSTSYQGMFGALQSGAVVKELVLTGLSISGGNQTGGLAGASFSSTITECFTSGSITGSGGETGGLVGTTQGSGSVVSKCGSTASVTTGANFSQGGLIGYTTNTTISNCYARGTVSVAGSGAGGLVGNHNSSSTITNSYASNSVTSSGGGSFIGGLVGGGFGGSSSTNSFYNSTLTGSSAQGTAKTNTQMLDNQTFIDASWDIYGVSSGTIWNMGNSRNDGYMYLQWQYPGDNPLPVELESFNARATGDDILLNWSTATEVNNYGFEIERKTEKTEWSYIGFIPGSGNSNSPKSYSFTDKNLQPDIYSYRLKQIDVDGLYKYYSTADVLVTGPESFTLYQNYPNPFNPSTEIKYSLNSSSMVTLSIYNSLGQMVSEIAQGVRDAGTHSITFAAADLPSGVYIYTISAVAQNDGKTFAASKKLTILK